MLTGKLKCNNKYKKKYHLKSADHPLPSLNCCNMNK